jgi:hypothetical protein
MSASSCDRPWRSARSHTAWIMLHQLRPPLVQPGARLAGTVEVDGTFIGGEEHGLRGGRQPGQKVLTGMAVETGGSARAVMHEAAPWGLLRSEALPADRVSAAQPVAADLREAATPCS